MLRWQKTMFNISTCFCHLDRGTLVLLSSWTTRFESFGGSIEIIDILLLFRRLGIHDLGILWSLQAAYLATAIDFHFRAFLIRNVEAHLEHSLPTELVCVHAHVLFVDNALAFCFDLFFNFTCGRRVHILDNARYSIFLLRLFDTAEDCLVCLSLINFHSVAIYAICAKNARMNKIEDDSHGQNNRNEPLNDIWVLQDETYQQE